jgi:SPP1 family predicted phage head-tail adaptor
MTSKQMPGAGERNNLITYMKPDDGEDEYGQPLGTYSFVAKAWADVKPATAREYTASRQTQAAIDAIIFAPYRTDIGATWIVVYDGQTYDIQSIAQVGYREGVQILARARQA